MKAFTCYNHSLSKVELSKHLEYIAELRPVELHLKEDGAKDNTPSIVIVMQDGGNKAVYGQISLKMLNEGLKDIGYELKKIQP